MGVLNKMKKKLLLAVVGALSVVTLAACSGNTNTEIATMKGGTLTVDDFYEKAKTDSSSQQIVFDMILSEVFMNKYGEDITDKEVEEEITNIFGDNFEEQLEASNLTREDVKNSVKERLAFEKGLKTHVELTDDDLKAAWETFHPEVEAQMIVVASEDEAKEVIEEASKDDADFAAIAQEKSLYASEDDPETMTFDSSTSVSEVPDEVKTVAWDLKDGAISDPIEVTSSYGQLFYVVKMVKNQDKGNDMSKFEDQINDIATETKLNDSTFTTKAIGEELIAANVKIKDEAFSDILSTFIEAAEPETATSTDSTEAETATTESTAVDATEDSE